MSNLITEQLCFPVDVEEIFVSEKQSHTEPIMFIPYEMNQLCLPPSLEELIPANHLVRVVNDAINRIDDAIFLKQYAGGGRSSYHPKLMTKIIVYGYMSRLYSSRQIAKAVRENIPFMWLSAMQTPGFRTINRFRSDRMKEIIDEVFTAVLQLLIEEGYVKLEHYFLDGTKIGANANRYSFVWKKATDKHQAKLQTKIRELLHEIDEVEQKEQAEYGLWDLEEWDEESAVTAEKLEGAVSHLEQKLAEDPKNKPLRKAVKLIRKNLLPRCAKIRC